MFLHLSKRQIGMWIFRSFSTRKTLNFSFCVFLFWFAKNNFKGNPKPFEFPPQIATFELWQNQVIRIAPNRLYGNEKSTPAYPKIEFRNASWGFQKYSFLLLYKRFEARRVRRLCEFCLSQFGMEKPMVFSRQCKIMFSKPSRKT